MCGLTAPVSRAVLEVASSGATTVSLKFAVRLTDTDSSQTATVSFKLEPKDSFPKATGERGGEDAGRVGAVTSRRVFIEYVSTTRIPRVALVKHLM